MKTRVDGGYAVITVGQFANVCEARRAGRISFLALRVWLAAHEQRAKRCCAKRLVRFTARELAVLIGRGTAEAAVRRALRKLQELSLIDWSEEAIRFPSEVTPDAETFAESLGTHSRRPVPVPRFILRALFRHTAPSEVMAAIAHLIRCLFKRGQEIRNAGLVSASWVASVFGVGERSVHATRRWLRGLGFMTQEVVHQLVMNRWGGKFVVALAQKREKRVTKSAPPKILKTCTLKYSENQLNNKPAPAGSGVRADSSGKPTLRNITFEDLKKLPRLELLYREAVKAGWLEATEANLRNFLCAALRATQAGGRVGAIFVGIVRKKLWHHVTQAQEDRVMTALRRYREKHPSAFRLSQPPREEAESKVSEVFKIVLNCATRPLTVPLRATSPAGKCELLKV